MSLRDKILNTKDIESEKVYIKQWGETVEVRGMTGKERSGILNECMNQKTQEINLERLYNLLVIRCTYDPETGEKVFQEADLEAVGNKSGGALERIAKVASRLSGLDEGQLEEAVKNSEGTQSEGSIST